MRLFVLTVFGAMFMSSVFAAEAPENYTGDVKIVVKKEPPWASVLECRDIKTNTVILTEKSLRDPDFNSPTYARIYDLTTGKIFYVFSMGADILCTATDRDTYEKRH